MKKILLLSFFVMITAIWVQAQEKVKVDVTVTENGKITSEKSYEFKDAESAEKALKTLDIISSSDERVIVETIEADGKPKKLAFISKDGNIEEEIEKVDVEWIEERTTEDGKKIEVVRVKRASGEDDCAGKDKEVSVKKKVIVITGDENEDVEWTVKEGEEAENVEVIVISREGSSESGEEVRVEVEVEQEKPDKTVKKKLKKK